MTLAHAIGDTVHISVLARKARRLGLESIDHAIALAVDRGCGHYRNVVSVGAPSVSRDVFGDEELLVFLLLGENRHEPFAIRTAAQLARSPNIRPRRLVFLAQCERVERVLAHIARAGVDHDHRGPDFWREILELLGDPPAPREGSLPHWSRFVSAPGIHRGHPVSAEWLVPR